MIGTMMRRYITLLSMAIMLLVGCSKPDELMAAPAKTTVSVNLHGVNYTADPFRYVVVDASNPSNKGGGEHIAPFSGGGTMCCFTLPKQWRPGLKLDVQATHWVEENGKGKLSEISKVYTVDVPRYAAGSVGDLWVLRTSDGLVEVVVSNVEPGHSEWPGKIKGWPEPSLAYQRDRWKIYRKLAEDNVKLYQELLAKMESDTNFNLSEDWEFDKKYRSELIGKYFGPTDPAYRQYKKQSYMDGLKRSKTELDEILKEKP